MKPRSLAALALLALAQSCQSPPSYVFKPRPLVIDVPAPDGSGIVARAVAAVLGVRAADEDEGRGDEIALRLSLENQSDRPISIDPLGWKLVAADLRAFGAPLVEPEPSAEILPGGEITLELAFPVPFGQELETYDLSGLNLRFALRYGDATIVPSATFERWTRVPYHDPYGDPYPYYSSGVNVGVGFSVSN